MGVVGITHYQKQISIKGLFIEKKRGGRNGYIQDFFPLLFSWQSLQLRTAELSPVPVTFPEAAEYSFVSWGPGSVCDDVGVWGKWSGNGNREVDTRGLVRQTAVCWAFRTEKQLARGTRGEEKSKGKKKNIHLFLLQFRQLGEHSAGGDVCQGLLIQFVPPILFLNLSADFIPGMLQDQCGQEWANWLQKSLQVERDPLKVSQCTSGLTCISFPVSGMLPWGACLKSGRLWEVTPLSGIIVHTLPPLTPTLEFWLKTKSQIPQV